MNASPVAKRIGRILIVDDCARMRQAIRATVGDLAEDIEEAVDGQAAVEAYFAHRPDWVTMDLGMRPMDGLTAVRAIRSRDPGARIVIVTVENTAAFCEAARRAGASGYLLKDDLIHIREFLEQDSLPVEDRPKPSSVFFVGSRCRMILLAFGLCFAMSRAMLTQEAGFSATPTAPTSALSPSSHPLAAACTTQLQTT